jgi:hypothetical protein
LLERWQNTGEHDVSFVLGSFPAHLRDQIVEVLFQPFEAISIHDQREQVYLDVETRKLRRELRSRKPFQNFDCHGRWSPSFVDEKQLLLGSNAADTRLEQPVMYHAFESAQVVQQCLGELPEFS